MPVIGLTGGIGSGKSTVADLFARHGAAIIDTDRIARDLVEPGSAALEAIRHAFGDTVLDADGTLDRAALRERVFRDAAARKRLEAILHPRIRSEVDKALARVEAPYAMVVVPLLVETGAYGDLLDRVLVVDCPEALQIERVMARSGFSRADVEAVMAVQATRTERLAVADDVIENVGPASGLAHAVARLHARYLSLP